MPNQQNNPQNNPAEKRQKDSDPNRSKPQSPNDRTDQQRDNR